MEYLLLQMLNGVQLGLLMFLLAAGLTLTFGIMDLVNLAHGSLYMMGAYIAWTLIGWTDSFVLGALAGAARHLPAGRRRRGHRDAKALRP
jgi:branched-chain amino acid transport system permease protein